VRQTVSWYTVVETQQRIFCQALKYNFRDATDGPKVWRASVEEYLEMGVRVLIVWTWQFQDQRQRRMRSILILKYGLGKAKYLPWADEYFR
jgi:hypothetical protein